MDIETEKLLRTPYDDLLKTFPGYTRRFLVQLKKRLQSQRKEVPMKIKDEVQRDADKKHEKHAAEVWKKRYEEAVRLLNAERVVKNRMLAIKDTVETYRIDQKLDRTKSEAVAVMVASDWHLEEEVNPKTVNGLNEYNLEIAKKRAENFWKNGLRLVQLESRDSSIETILVPLLGDFFSNDIHEQLLELNQLPPMEAILLAQTTIASGIEFLLKNSSCTIVLPCHSGNHARDTQKLYISNEAGHSFEYLMYHNLASFFKNNKRVKFVIADGYHSFVDVYGMKLRFHHGHHIRYAGGVGGIYIPVNKAVAQWNKAKQADLDVFGHFHQLKDGGNFVSNGSLVGWNAYAQSIKADFERPQQTFFLIHKTKGRLGYKPILVE